MYAGTIPVMVTLSLSDPAAKIVALPTREELRAMLSHPAVAITAIVCVTLFCLGSVGGVILLALNGKGTEAVGVFILGLMTLILGKLSRVQEQVRAATTTTTTDGGSNGS